jgi:diguanylate cyclase (GGDEF)-like protein
MWHRPDFYIPLIYLLGAIPYAVLGLYAWHRRPAVAVTPFAWAMLGCSIWSFGYGLEVFFPSLLMKLLAVNIEYIGIIIIPVFLLFFAVEFTGKSHLLSPRTRYVIWVIPVATLILVWMNPWLRLMWSMETVEEAGGLLLLDIRRGFFFWLHIFYSYALVLVAVILLAMDLLQRPGFYRIQIGLVILCVLFPLIGNIIFISDSGPLKNLDLTPLFFIPTALGLSWAVFKYRLLEVLPPEHFTVLKNMKNGVIILNPQGRILYINPVMEGLMDRREDEVIGQPLAHVAESLFAKLAPCLVGGKQHVEISFDDNGQPAIYDVSVSLAHHQDCRVESEPNRVIVFHDITARKEVEADLSRREAVMSAINFAAEHFLKESRWEHHIPAVLEKLGQAANVSRVFVSVNYVDDKNITYSSLCYEWVAPGVSSHIRNPALQHVPFRAAGFGRWENMLSQNLPIHGLVRELPETERKYLHALGSVSFAAIPIFVERHWWGFIMFDECQSERVWSNTELKAFHAAANIFGAAETRARTEQKLFRRQNALNLLHKIVETALKAETIEEMGQVVVDRMGELIHADGCFLTLWDDTGKRTIPLASFGSQKDTYLSLTIQPGERTFTESALTLGHTLVIEDVTTTPYVDQRIVQAFPARSVLVLPLAAASEKLGAIILVFNNTHRFTPGEISISEQAAALIALALEKFQAVEEARRRANASETLRRAASAVTETLETDQTVNRILEQLQQVIAYDGASIHMRIGEELVIVGVSGFPDMNAILGLRFRVTDKPQSIVLETGKPYFIPDLDSYDHGFKDVASLHIRSWVGLPLIVRDKTIGLLAIDSLQPNHFKEKDIQLATEFAGQVAAALENARLFEETQTQAITDPLTGIYNRRGLFQLGELEFKRARRSLHPFCAMMFDIDLFKRINDHHGHTVGDQTLRQLVQCASQSSRTIDLFGRYGGEEFIILLPETSLSSAQRIAERLRKIVMDEPFETDAGALRITISIGVAGMKKEDTLQSLLERADAALYRAKDAGRNCVMTDDGTQPRRQT